MVGLGRRLFAATEPQDQLAKDLCPSGGISKKRAFFVRIDSFGMDSFLSYGFAGNSGKVYNVTFDSLGWNPDPDIEVLDNSHDAV